MSMDREGKEEYCCQSSGLRNNVEEQKSSASVCRQRSLTSSSLGSSFCIIPTSSQSELSTPERDPISQSFSGTEKSENNTSDINMNDEDSSEPTESKMERLVRERDFAIYEAEEAKEALANIMEAVEILTRQMKRSHYEYLTFGGSDSSATMDLTQEEEEVPQRNLSTDEIENEHHQRERQSQPVQIRNNQLDKEALSFGSAVTPVSPLTHHSPRKKNGKILFDCNRPHNWSGDNITSHTNGDRQNRGRSYSGLSVSSSVATYLSEDDQRFSELISISNDIPILDTIGSNLMALRHACHMVGENALLISEEASTSVKDLQDITISLKEETKRASKAERCAKYLYKQNKALKVDLDKAKQNLKVVVKELKIQQKISEEKDRLKKEEKKRGMEEHVFGALQIHERIMMENSLQLKHVNRDVSNSLREVDGPVSTVLAEKHPDESLKKGKSEMTVSSEEKENNADKLHDSNILQKENPIVKEANELHDEVPNKKTSAGIPFGSALGFGKFSAPRIQTTKGQKKDVTKKTQKVSKKESTADDPIVAAEEMSTPTKEKEKLDMPMSPLPLSTMSAGTPTTHSPKFQELLQSISSPNIPDGKDHKLADVKCQVKNLTEEHLEIPALNKKTVESKDVSKGKKEKNDSGGNHGQAEKIKLLLRSNIFEF